MEKFQDVLDKNVYNKYGVLSGEFIKNNLENLSQVKQLSGVELEGINVKVKKDNLVKKEKMKKRKENKSLKKVVEEEVGKIVDMEG